MYIEYSAGQNYIRTLTQGVSLIDNRKTNAIYKRAAIQTVKAEESVNRSFIFSRIIFEIAGLLEKVKPGKTMIRVARDVVQVAGNVFRGLIFHIKIQTQAFVRDYILGRFLKARSNIEIKSVICREIVLESKIQ